MIRLSSHRRRLPALVGVAALALVVAGLADGRATAELAPGARAPAAAPSAPSGTGKVGGSGEAAGNYDSRALATPALVRNGGKSLRENGAAVNRLARTIGGDASVSVDALTGTPTDVSSRLGFLTGPSKAPAARVALDFVRGHLAGLGLSAADVGTFSQSRKFTDINGITHVYWVQKVGGIPVFGNGLRASVDRRGRLISLQGAPVSQLTGLAERSASPRLSGRDAIRAAVRDVRGDAARSGATSQRVWFLTTQGLRQGWVTYTRPSGTEGYQHVIDATTGRTLYRRSTVAFEKRPRAKALVHENYPGARGTQAGGRQHTVDLRKRGFLPKRATWMRGPYASVWADVNDDDQVQEREKSRVPANPRRPRFPFVPFPTGVGQEDCTNAYKCTWDPTVPKSWKVNKNQDGVQGLYFTSKFAVWLKRAPFGFTPALGNFERKGGDPVLVHTMDGADTDNGLPDGGHVNNANFSTPPDGTPPIMQMYLNNSPYLAASSTNAFDNIGHEYTHGLSNRLVVDSMGFSTLNSYQAGGMGEGWGDFYSFDYLLDHGLLENNENKSGELMYDRYLSKNRAFTRTQAIDCAVGEDARLCKQVDGVGVGGYTYGDIPRQLTTEVHNAGEVWAQAMWDIHEVLGHEVTMRLVTSAMTLAPNDPSMLDMRDAMITADKVIYSKRHTAQLWKRFAARGYGYFAASIDAADTEPVEDFHRPPAAGLTPGSISGTVTDTNGDPIAGAVVLVAGRTSGAIGNYSDVTDAAGEYQIGGVVPGTYPKLVALGDGFESANTPVTVVEGEDTDVDLALRRDWAAASGGASVVDFEGVDYTPFGCGPGGLIDLSQGTGWGSTSGATEDPITSADQIDPKSIVIELPQAIDITAFAVDPGSTCGDAGSASTGDYLLEVAAAAAGPWVEAASGTFTVDDRGVMVDIPVTVPDGMQYVRYTMLSPQVPDFAGCPDDFAGCTYMDSSELAVYDD